MPHLLYGACASTLIVTIGSGGSDSRPEDRVARFEDGMGPNQSRSAAPVTQPTRLRPGAEARSRNRAGKRALK